MDKSQKLEVECKNNMYSQVYLYILKTGKNETLIWYIQINHIVISHLKNKKLSDIHMNNTLIMSYSGDGSKVQCCKEQYCIGTWNVRSMNQGKL